MRICPHEVLARQLLPLPASAPEMPRPAAGIRAARPARFVSACAVAVAAREL